MVTTLLDPAEEERKDNVDPRRSLKRLSILLCCLRILPQHLADVGIMAESSFSGSRAELLQRKPGFSCDFARRRLFYIKDAAQLDLYVEGLQRAGLPA